MAKLRRSILNCDIQGRRRCRGIGGEVEMVKTSTLLEMFERADLIKNDEVNYLRLESISKTQLVDICKQTIDLTINENVKPTDTVFSHSASISLGGGTTPCSDIKCRKSKLKQLVQFTALYSDRVYIENLFTKRVAQSELLKEDEFKRNVLDDMLLMLYIRPMLDSGIIVPVTSKNTCSYCLANNKCGAEEPDCFDDVKEHLYAMFDENVSVEMESVGAKSYWVRASGPSSLLAHGSSSMLYNFKDLPEKVRGSDLIKNLKRNRAIKLPGELKMELGYHRHIANDHLDTIRFEISNALVLKSSYLSEQPLHIDILNKYFANTETQKN